MSWNHKIAYRFGQTEHEAGRIMFIPMAATVALIYYEHYNIAIITALLTILCWLVYIISHTLEKKFYGKGKRG